MRLLTHARRPSILAVLLATFVVALIPTLAWAQTQPSGAGVAPGVTQVSPGNTSPEVGGVLSPGNASLPATVQQPVVLPRTGNPEATDRTPVFLLGAAALIVGAALRTRRSRGKTADHRAAPGR